MFDTSDTSLAQLDRLVREWIQPARYTSTAAVNISAWEAPAGPVPFHEAVQQSFSPFEVGRSWSRPWGTTWFKVVGTVPDGWESLAHRTELAVDLDFNNAMSGFQAEALAYTESGTVLKALEPHNRYIPINAHPGEKFCIYIEAASNPVVMPQDWVTPTSLGSPETAGTDPIYCLRSLELCQRCLEVDELLIDFEVLRGLVDILPADSPRRAEVLSALALAANAVDIADVAGSAAAARSCLAPVLRSPAAASAHHLHAVGHAHIDSAWLWPIRETRRKVARTFANVLKLMEEDPEFVFAASSAQQYQWVKEDHPELFARVCQRVEQGRWIPVGGSWIECDPCMPSGESLIRQFVHGQSFFQEELGVVSDGVWLPDSFGYSASLPEIAHHVGMQWMLTQKLSWNDTNTFPHHTFLWEGLDGQQIFTHFPPVDTYLARLNAVEMRRAQSQFNDHQGSSHSLIPFGYGDGGGGPTREHLKRAKRLQDLEGFPKVELSSPQKFFSAAQSEYTSPPVWAGELYLENHRGVFTTQTELKRGNRKVESLLHAAELWAATAAVRGLCEYPHAELQELWQSALLLQFHDILPGSSIEWVHREAKETYQQLIDHLNTLIDRCVQSLTGAGDAPLSANSGVVPNCGIAAGAISQTQGTPSSPACQIIAEDSGWELSNEKLRLHVNAQGYIDSLYDLDRQRELLPPQTACGSLRLYRDIPGDFDAWNLDYTYQQVSRSLGAAQSVSIEEQPDGSVQVCSTWKENNSAYCMTAVLSPGSDSIDFHLEVDWQEKHELLKLEFPLLLHTLVAQSEVQFGHVTRPIHTNTSWDNARFETVGHRWVRVAEPDYGVAIANVQTYGHSFTRRTSPAGNYVLVGESLLRGSCAPDPSADAGQHVFSFRLIVGASTQQAIAEGYRLNAPLLSITGEQEVFPLVEQLSGSGVVETVKLAHDGSGDVIVRLYESLGTRSQTVLRLNWQAGPVRCVDGLEREMSEIDSQQIPKLSVLEGTAENEIAVDLLPFQICTLRIGSV